MPHCPSTLKLFTEPNTHILAQTFYTAAPLRYGDYVAKISVAPSSTSVKGCVASKFTPTLDADAQRDMVVDFFHSNSAEYEVRAQLCTNPDEMPIEDATKAVVGIRFTLHRSREDHVSCPERGQSRAARLRGRRAVLQLVAFTGRPPPTRVD